MPLLLVKIFLSTALVAAATLVQRRYGHRASGFLVGLPITTAPYLLLVALQHGSQFTIHSAQGVLQGQVALVLFIAAYAHAPSPWPWWLTLGSVTAFALLVTVLISQRLFPPLLIFVTLIAIWLLAIRFWPATSVATAPVEHASWEMPVRLLVTLTILVGLTQIAPSLGATLAGGLATLPVISIVLCGATHRRFGPAGPRQFLRGLLISLPGSTTFSLAVALLAPSINIYLALSIALGLTLAVAAWQSRNLSPNRGSVDTKPWERGH
jgi:hypothetical protein